MPFWGTNENFLGKRSINRPASKDYGRPLDDAQKFFARTPKRQRPAPLSHWQTSPGRAEKCLIQKKDRKTKN